MNELRNTKEEKRENRDYELQTDLCARSLRAFGVKRPLWPVVLVQVNSLLLAQPAHLVVKLPGDVDVSCRDRSGDAFGPEKPVDLGGGGEDPVAGSGPQHQPHVCPGQVKVA